MKVGSRFKKGSGEVLANEFKEYESPKIQRFQQDKILQQNGVYRRAVKIEKPVERRTKIKSRSQTPTLWTVEVENILTKSELANYNKESARKSQNPLYK